MFDGDEKARSDCFQYLKRRGDHEHNLQTLRSKRGYFVVARSPDAGQSVTHDDYRPCPNCLLYLNIHELSRHEKTTCDRILKSGKSTDQREGQRSLVRKSNLMIMDGTQEISKEMKYLLSKLSDDAVGRAVKEDPVILEVGQDLLDKQVQKTEQSNYIKERMRELGRLLVEMRKKPGNSERSLKSFISVTEWDFFISTVKKMGVDQGKPTLALKLGYNMVKVCDVVWTQCIKERDQAGAEEARNFQQLYEKNFTKKIGSQSVKRIHDAHLNKETKMVKTDDVVKLCQGLKEDISRFLKRFEEEPNANTYSDLSQAVMTYLMVYNRKRAGELARTKLQNFHDATRNQLGQQKEEIAKLPKVEQALAKFHLLMQIKGKKGRHVSVLIPKLCEEALVALQTGREACGVVAENPYLFPQQSGDSHLNPWPIVRKFAMKYELDDPDSIKSTALRKHLATSVQVLNLKENEMDHVADHMVRSTCLPLA